MEAEQRLGSCLQGKWHLERLLGVGGMAAVYEARHRNTGRVAIKVLHRRTRMTQAQLARFKREGYAANRVGHSAVVRIYDDDVDENGCPFLVMELLDGETLAARARACGGRLTPAEVISIAVRTLDVLVVAHARGILHRDIKPDNLFITSAGELKLLDFGIARVLDPELESIRTEVGTLLGTPAFLPPEQARGRIDQVDVRSDVWALGATLFTLLTGRYVHEANTPNEQLGLAMTAAAPSLATVNPEVPKRLAQVVDRALAYEPNERWSDAASMLAAVSMIAAESEAPARDSTPRDLVGAEGCTFSPTTLDPASQRSGLLTGPDDAKTGAHATQRTQRILWAAGTASVAAIVLLNWARPERHVAMSPARPKARPAYTRSTTAPARTMASPALSSAAIVVSPLTGATSAPSASARPRGARRTPPGRGLRTASASAPVPAASGETPPPPALAADEPENEVDDYDRRY